MKDRLKKYLSRGRRALLMRFLPAGLIAVAGVALAYSAFTPGEQADADRLLSAHPAVLDSKDVTRRAILHWMEENSHMPKQVLSRVYGAAVKSVNPDLVLAICVVESNFNPRAVSDKGAVGLMGVMPGVWLDDLKAHGIVNAREDLYEIPNNIASGLYVLKWCLASTNSLREALFRYSGGDSRYPDKVLMAVGKISVARRQAGNFYVASAGD